MWLPPARAHRQYCAPRSSPAGLRHSDPPAVRQPTACLLYAEFVPACCARRLMFAVLFVVPYMLPSSHSAPFLFLFAVRICYMPANSAASSPLQNGERAEGEVSFGEGPGVRFGCPQFGFRPIVRPVSPSIRVQIFVFCPIVQSFTGSLIAPRPPLSRMERGQGVRFLSERGRG